MLNNRLASFILLLTISSLSVVSAVEKYSDVTMLCLVNKERSRQGLKPLGLDPKLTQAAYAHSRDQARTRKMSHTGSDGSSPSQRVTRAGFKWRSTGENVAYGYNSMAQVMKTWMNSPGHRRNILGSQFTMFGSGVAYSGSTPYYTQEFASDGQAARNVPKCDGSDSDYGNGGGGDGGDYDGGDNGGGGGGDYGGDMPPSRGGGGGGSDYGGDMPPSRGGGGGGGGDYGGDMPPSRGGGGGGGDYGGDMPPSRGGKDGKDCKDGRGGKGGSNGGDYGGDMPSNGGGDYDGNMPGGGRDGRRRDDRRGGGPGGDYGGDMPRRGGPGGGMPPRRGGDMPRGGRRSGGGSGGPAY